MCRSEARRNFKGCSSPSVIPAFPFPNSDVTSSSAFSGGSLKRRACLATVLLSITALSLLSAKDPKERHQIYLPTSKLLTAPSPGRLGPLNSFPATIALSPDNRYAALLNDGYGTQDDQAHQSIAIVDLNTNQITDFPDDRLPEDAHQSYLDRKSTRLNSSHDQISYAVFCLKKKK